MLHMIVRQCHKIVGQNNNSGIRKQLKTYYSIGIMSEICVMPGKLLGITNFSDIIPIKHEKSEKKLTTEPKVRCTP